MQNINIKGLHIEVTDALRQYVNSKLASLSKFIPHTAHVRVEIGRPSAHHKSGSDIYMAEIETDWNGQTYYIQVADADQYAAIDRARDEITEMIKAGRGKKQALWKRGQSMMKDAMKWDFVTPIKNLPKKLRGKLWKNADEV